MASVVLIWVTFAMFHATCLGHWQNDFDGPLDFNCDDISAITGVNSIHSNHYEDRRFELSCTRVGGTRPKAKCNWSPYVNKYDEPVYFNCPGNHYMNGMSSIHNNHYEDRIWKFRCCHIPGITLANCQTTGWTNNFDQPQHFSIPTGYAVTGTISEHNNHYEDRRFRYSYCAVHYHAMTTDRPKHLIDYLMVQDQEWVDEK